MLGLACVLLSLVLAVNVTLYVGYTIYINKKETEDFSTRIIQVIGQYGMKVVMFLIIAAVVKIYCPGLLGLLTLLGIYIGKQTVIWIVLAVSMMIVGFLLTNLKPLIAFNLIYHLQNVLMNNMNLGTNLNAWQMTFDHLDDVISLGCMCHHRLSDEPSNTRTSVCRRVLTSLGSLPRHEKTLAVVAFLKERVARLSNDLNIVYNKAGETYVHLIDILVVVFAFAREVFSYWRCRLSRVHVTLFHIVRQALWCGLLRLAKGNHPPNGARKVQRNGNKAMKEKKMYVE